MNPDAISRLKSQLITSGLQTKDNALFQVVNQLINAVTDATVLALATDVTVGNIVSGINQLTGDVLAGPGTGSQVATLAATAVTAGSYGDATHVATFTVDAKGRLTAAANLAITFPAAGITQLTGDGTAGPGSGSQAFTLANTAVTPGTYGDATHVAQITVDAKGRATAVASVLITDTGITQLTGDVTAGPGSGSVVATLAASGVAAATYGDATHVPQIAVDAKGRITLASNIAISSAGGFDIIDTYKRTHFFCIYAQGSNFIAYGINSNAAGSAGGTASVAQINTTGDYARLATSATGIGQTSNLSFNNNPMIDWSIPFDIYWIVQTPADLSSIRIWFALATSAPTNSDTYGGGTPQRILSFRYSTPAGDGGWVGVSGDASGSQGVTSTIASIATNTRYTLRLQWDGSANASFSVNGGTPQTLTTFLPSGATRVGFVMAVYTQTAGVRSCDWQRTFGTYGS